MSTIMIVLLCIDALLLVSLLTYVVISLLNHDQVNAQVVAEPATAKVEAEPEKKEEPVKEIATTEVKEEKPVEPVKEVAIETELEDTEDDRETVKRIPFAQKMLFIDKKTQSYYNAINNAFKAMRKVNARVSTKGVSYRLGRDLVAKITVRGKTMKLHLALDVNKFDEKIYFQKDLSAVKAYADVPCTVKVKSDRGLKNALKLVDALAETHGIEKKMRFIEVDSIELLKEIVNKK